MRYYIIGFSSTNKSNGFHQSGSIEISTENKSMPSKVKLKELISEELPYLTGINIISVSELKEADYKSYLGK